MLSILGKCQVEPFRQRYCDISHEVNASRPTAAYGLRARQFTGEVGVCLATSGPGAIHL